MGRKAGGTLPALYVLAVAHQTGATSGGKETAELNIARRRRLNIAVNRPTGAAAHRSASCFKSPHEQLLRRCLPLFAPR